ncbi:MAG: ECF-type sigma factor [Planctomycetota bacterium]
MTDDDAPFDADLTGLAPDVRGEVARRLPAVYAELRRRAAACLDDLPPGQSLAPTELCHEAYVKLTRSDGEGWSSDEHFVLAASLAMRHIAIDRIKRRLALKRGGHLERLSLDEIQQSEVAPEDQLALVIDECLGELEREHPRGAQLVTMRFFLGLSEEGAAKALSVSDRTVRRDWVFAKAWLTRELANRGFSPKDVENGR